MKRKEYKFPLTDSNLNRLQFLCLYLACIMTFLFLIFDTRIHALMIACRLGLLGSCVLFCVVSYIQMRNNRTRFPSRLAILMVVWFLITQLIQFTSGRIYHHYTQFLPVYLLAYPFAAVTHDEERQTGLKALALVYLAAFLIWILYAALLLADRVPASMQYHVMWDGTRMVVFRHANNSSRGLMIGIAIALGFSFKTPRKWAKLLLLVAAALMFVCLALTNSRTAILITCLLIGGIVFFSIPKRSWKQFAACGVLAFVLAAALFLISQEIFQWNSQRLINTWRAPQNSVQQDAVPAEQQPCEVISLCARTVPEQNPSILSDPQNGNFLMMSSANIPEDAAVNSFEAFSPQKSFIQDLATFNSRTTIWRLSLQRIRENPSILLWGANHTELMIDGDLVNNAHNSWMEVLLRMGIPGLIISLIFTWQALSSSVVLLFHRQVDIWKKIISLLVVCILLCSFFESTLFFSTFVCNYIDFLFFLCLGYMNLWKNQIDPKPFIPGKTC